MVIGLAVALVAALVALVVVVRTLTEAQKAFEKAWSEERRELLNRIVRPEFVPITASQVPLPEPIPDEWNLVGTINRDIQEDS